MQDFAWIPSSQGHVNTIVGSKTLAILHDSEGQTLLVELNNNSAILVVITSTTIQEDSSNYSTS